MKIISLVQKYALRFAWLQAFIATVGSLFFSEVMKYPACTLCWYQRIFMYPLVLIIAVGIYKKDKHLPFYALPLSSGGMLVAFYQTLLQWNFLPEAAGPCQIGVSCITKQLNLFGFITIPFLSFLAFLVITVCLVLHQKLNLVSMKSHG